MKDFIINTVLFAPIVLIASATIQHFTPAVPLWQIFAAAMVATVGFCGWYAYECRD